MNNRCFCLYCFLVEDYPGRVSGKRTGSVSDVMQREFVAGQRLFGHYTLLKILANDRIDDATIEGQRMRNS